MEFGDFLQVSGGGAGGIVALVIYLRYFTPSRRVENGVTLREIKDLLEDRFGQQHTDLKRILEILQKSDADGVLKIYNKPSVADSIRTTETNSGLILQAIDNRATDAENAKRDILAAISRGRCSD